ncbi:hypothetical protein B0O99DRAFT_588134 [Bisporella sp. PMI_857]|nr:hypothetical protein B0O99DRAFT_588134 [Bisporella sp. PMI_857]
MKTNFFAIAVAALAGFCSAQGSLPSCAQNCVIQFTSGSSIGDCSNVDAKCICSSPTFLSDIACCLAGACSPADQQSATDYAKSFCAISGVTNLPDAVVCSSTTAGSSTTAPSSTGTGSPASITSSPSVTSSPVNAATTTSSAATTSSTPNAGAQNAAGFGAAGLGLLAMAIL